MQFVDVFADKKTNGIFNKVKPIFEEFQIQDSLVGQYNDGARVMSLSKNSV